MFVLYRAYSYVSFRRCYFVVSFAPLRAFCVVGRGADCGPRRFLDMLMSKALGEPNTEPKNYTDIFEVRRGIIFDTDILMYV